MTSGVKVADACKIIYEEVKKDKKHRYVVFHIKDGKEIDVEVIGNRNQAYDDFLEDLQKGGPEECRYGLFDFEYTHQCQGTSEASKKQKLFLMLWCPDTATIKRKMVYSSSFDALKKALHGVSKTIQEMKVDFYNGKQIQEVIEDVRMICGLKMYSLSEATDLNEASQETVEDILRRNDRE